MKIHQIYEAQLKQNFRVGNEKFCDREVWKERGHEEFVEALQSWIVAEELQLVTQIEENHAEEYSVVVLEEASDQRWDDVRRLSVEMMIETEDGRDEEFEENAVVKEPIFDETLKEFLVFYEEIAEDEADDEVSSIHVGGVEKLVEPHVIGLMKSTKKTRNN